MLEIRRAVDLASCEYTTETPIRRCSLCLAEALCKKILAELPSVIFLYVPFLCGTPQLLFRRLERFELRPHDALVRLDAGLIERVDIGKLALVGDAQRQEIERFIIGASPNRVDSFFRCL